MSAPDAAGGGPAPAVAAFIRLQLDALEPYDFVSIGSPQPPFAAAQVGRTAAAGFEIRVPMQDGGQPLAVQQRNRLVELGFRSDDAADPTQPWKKEVADADAALQTALTAMVEVLGGTVHDTLNVLHGSTKAMVEAERRLVELRGRIEPMLTAITGHAPKQDPDGDYAMQIGPVPVIVVPRVIPGAIAVVRVIAVTNNEVTIGPELGLFLARLNFGLMFGRFALDAEHRAIWFDETLLGDDITEAQLRFTVDMVARTAQEWRDRLQHMFGGTIGTIEPPAAGALATAQHKPGAAGYL